MDAVTNQPLDPEQAQWTLEDAYDIMLDDELREILTTGDPGPQGPDPLLDR